MNTILTATKREVTAYLLGGELNATTFATMAVDLDYIACPVKERELINGYDFLKWSIITNGMTDPVILLPNSQSVYDMAIRQVDKRFINNFDPSAKLLAYTGSQRISIAKELDYMAIEAVIVEDVHWAHSVQLMLQDGVIKHETRTIQT